MAMQDGIKHYNGFVEETDLIGVSMPLSMYLAGAVTALLIVTFALLPCPCVQQEIKMGFNRALNLSEFYRAKPASSVLGLPKRGHGIELWVHVSRQW